MGVLNCFIYTVVSFHIVWLGSDPRVQKIESFTSGCSDWSYPHPVCPWHCEGLFEHSCNTLRNETNKLQIDMKPKEVASATYWEEMYRRYYVHRPVLVSQNSKCWCRWQYFNMAWSPCVCFSVGRLHNYCPCQNYYEISAYVKQLKGLGQL